MIFFFRPIRSYFFNYIIFVLILTSCSDIRLKRDPSSLDLSSLKSEVALGYFDQLSVHRKSDLQNLFQNTFRYFLEATYKDTEKQRDYIRKGLEYFEFNRKKVELAITDEIFDKKILNSSLVSKVPSWTLKDEVEFLDNEFSHLRKLATDQYLPIEDIDQSFNEMRKLYQMYSPLFYSKEINQSNSLEIKSFHFVDQFFKAKDLSQAMSYFEKDLDRVFNTMIEEVLSLFDNQRFSKKNKDMDLFFKNFIRYYFEHLERDVLKNIVSDLISLNKQPLKSDIIHKVFLNIGPALGKIFQQMAKQVDKKSELRAIFQILESDGKKVPFYLVKSLIKSDTGGYEIRSISHDPLGVGTVAQVHKASLRTNGHDQNVAVRLIKPNSVVRVNQDIEIIDHFFVDAYKEGIIEKKFLSQIQSIFDGVKLSLKEDMNIPLTVRNQELAFSQYNLKKTFQINGKKIFAEIKVPKVYLPPNKNLSESKIQVQELIVKAEKFSKLKNKFSKLAISRLLVEQWYDEAFFGSGRFHGDLHEGNYLIRSSEGGSKNTIYILDFGMYYKISKKIKRAFILIGAGGNFQDSKLISKAITSLQPKLNINQKVKIEKEIEQIMKKKKWTGEEWILWGIKNGYIISDELATISRGANLINQLPMKVNDKSFLNKIFKKLSLSHVPEMFYLNSRNPISISDGLSIGFSSVKKSCKSLIAKILGKKKN